MPTIAKITLLFVVFVDLIGQGLVFPIINSLIMEPTGDFLPKSASDAVRHIDYGLVIGIFFLAWFLGVVYVAKLSDSIGRKNTLLVCLAGALVGYALTIVSFYLNSLWLLILGRAVTGFTAGNQPVAQAAMVDASVDDAERDRNMGYLMIGVSAGLVAGPIIGGVLTDKELLGGIASLDMPFYGALVLVVIAIGMVLVFFKDIRTEREPFAFRPAEIFESLWRVTERPLVLKLMPAYRLLHGGERHVLHFRGQLPDQRLRLRHHRRQCRLSGDRHRGRLFRAHSWWDRPSSASTSSGSSGRAWPSW